MSGRSVVKGAAAERDVARRLNRWALGVYEFRRRGLGHKSVADLVVRSKHGVPIWPFAISVKSEQGPTVAAMLRAVTRGDDWRWWREVAGRFTIGLGDVEERRRASAWLVWRSGRAWMLSCWTLGGLEVPPRLALLPYVSGWPRFTMRLDAFLSAVPPMKVAEAIANGWGQA